MSSEFATFHLVLADRRATARTTTFVEPCSIQTKKTTSVQRSALRSQQDKTRSKNDLSNLLFLFLIVEQTLQSFSLSDAKTHRPAGPSVSHERVKMSL